MNRVLIVDDGKEDLESMKSILEKNGCAIFLCKKSDSGNLLIEETLHIFDKVVK